MKGFLNNIDKEFCATREGTTTGVDTGVGVTAIPVGEVVSGSVVNGNDVKYQFPVTSGSTYTATLTPSSSTDDPDLLVFDNLEKMNTYWDVVDANGGEGSAAAIAARVGKSDLNLTTDSVTFTASGNQNYFILLSGPETQTANYSLKITESSAAKPIVGSWGSAPGEAQPTDSDPWVLTFYDNGFYIHYQTGDGTDCVTGLEYGTYIFDSTANILNVTPTHDSNGTCGIGPDPRPLTVSGDTFSLGPPEDSTVLGRVVSVNSPIVGSWGSVPGEAQPTDSDPWVLTFYDNGFYIHYQTGAGTDCVTGLEYGTYIFDSTANILNVTPTHDANGTCGIGPDPRPLTVSGDTFSLGPADDSAVLGRVK